MDDCNPVTAPMDHNHKLSIEMSPKTDVERPEMDHIPYQEAIGSFMYAAMVTGPMYALLSTQSADSCKIVAKRIGVP